jgi:hypothetical protein
MANRRRAIIAALSIVELWILGLMIRSVSGGGGRESSFASAAAMQPAGFDRTIETGSTPRVVIDDDDAALTVTVRVGTAVEVRERIRARGWGMRDAKRESTVEKTADGVRVTGPDGIIIAGAGSVSRALDVVVPPGATLEVKNAGATSVAGLTGEATLHIDDGDIIVTRHSGPLTASTGNGHIELRDVAAPAVDVSTDDGRIDFYGVEADDVSATTDNGRIEIVRSVLRSGKIKTDNGRIRLGLDPRSNVTVSAQTSDGKIDVRAPLSATRASDDDDAPSLIRIGGGGGHLDVGSDDGSITVFAGGV